LSPFATNGGGFEGVVVGRSVVDGFPVVVVGLLVVVVGLSEGHRITELTWIPFSISI